MASAGVFLLLCEKFGSEKAVVLGKDSGSVIDEGLLSRTGTDGGRGFGWFGAIDVASESIVDTDVVSASALEELISEEAFREAVEEVASSTEANPGLGLDDVRGLDFPSGCMSFASSFREDFVLSLEISRWLPLDLGSVALRSVFVSLTALDLTVLDLRSSFLPNSSAFACKSVFLRSGFTGLSSKIAALNLFPSSLTTVGLVLLPSSLYFAELVLLLSLATDGVVVLFLSSFNSEDVDLLFSSSLPAEIDVPPFLSSLLDEAVLTLFFSSLAADGVETFSSSLFAGSTVVRGGLGGATPVAFCCSGATLSACDLARSVGSGV